MKFGLFMEETWQGISQAGAFEEKFRRVDAAEAWGLHGVWLGELHFNPTRSVLSAPLVMAGAIAARTRRLRVGTAVTVLPLSNPLRIAEDVASVDQISQGRFDFGVGRSGAVYVYDVLGVPYAESQARFLEALEIIRQAWKGERFSYKGQFYRFENAVVAPKPYQQPHPPIRMAATSEETFAQVGRLGIDLFVGLRTMDIPELRTHLATYRQAWRDAGHPGEPSVHLRIPIYAALTETAAMEEPRESIVYFFGRQAELARSADRRQAVADRLSSLTYEQILSTRVAFGTAARLVDRLTELREALGLDGIVVELNPGGMIPAERELRSLRILTHEVMPALAA